ncbi:MAG: cytochrome C biogenesis protein [Ignavibacteria bacterium]|nr:cytochrome C biogenesis protein [Ignavibacteria bacterium]
MIGNILLTLALLAGVFSIYMYYLTYKGYQNTIKLARYSFHLTAIAVLTASALLLHAILTHQYQYKYIYNYSSSDLPLGLLMATFYAGQEGSFMLWVLFSAIIGLILLDYTSKRGDLEPRVMMIFTLALAFLLVMVNPLLKSPFNYIWSQPDFIDLKNINQSYLSLPALQSFIFSDPQSNKQFIQMSKDLYGVLTANNISVNNFIIEGKGLNPLLQNFWMQIHPPVLFVGFAMSVVPFAFALSALIKNEYKDWVKQALPWMLMGTMVLGLAIMLGGYWAYGVLGWGGYWGWDPVENSSLVPWLVGVASIHTILVQKKTQEKGSGRFIKTNLILSIMTFVLVLYSTFLTRSGILGDASVHSFVDPGMTVYLFLVIFLGLFIVLGLGMIIYRWKYLTENFTFEENVLSRELALFTGSVALLASAIIVLVGTSAPIFGQTVELKFYNELNLPIAIIIALVNGLSLLLKWKHTDSKLLLDDLKFSGIASIVLTLLIVFLGSVYDIMLVILTLSAAFALFVNGEIAFRIFKGKRSYLGAYIAHIGIAVFLIGVVATGGYSQESQVDLVKGEKVSTLGYDLTFTGYSPIDNGKKYAFNIEVSKNGSVRTAAPVMYIAEFNNSLMREPDILVGLTKDFYVAPVSYSEGTEGEQDHNHGIPMTKGQTIDHEGLKIVFDSFEMPKDAMSSMTEGKEFRISAILKLIDGSKETIVKPSVVISSGTQKYEPVFVKEKNLKFELTNINAGSGQIELLISDIDGKKESGSKTAAKEVLTVDASIKPFISLVWIGVLFMVIGYIISAVRRSRESVE